MLLPHSRSLFAVTPATNLNMAGTSKLISCAALAVPPVQKALVHITQSGGATSPTVTVKVETSVDNTNWVKVAELVTDTTTPTKNELLELPALAKHLRASATVGGGTPPNYTASVSILCTDAFSLK
jgi:hypothetical protein